MPESAFRAKTYASGPFQRVLTVYFPRAAAATPNTLVFYAIVRGNAIRLDSISSVVSDPKKIVPAGLAILISTLMNGLLSTDTKARLVFLRWRDVLTGHRAFSKYANSDSRVDPGVLRQIVGRALPVEPVEQNRTWYKLYKSVEKEPAVDQVHRDFLLMRDYTGLAVLFLIFNGPVGFWVISSSKVCTIYLVALAAQYALARQAACHYGVRMVTTVLAQTTAKHSLSASPRRGKSKLASRQKGNNEQDRQLEPGRSHSRKVPGK
jgi:hypothetical protein